MKSITERRAKFVYDGARLAAQAAEAPIVPEPWDQREQAFQRQFFEVIEGQCGRPDKCPDCGGSGIAFGNDPPTGYRCETCDGTWKVATPAKLHEDWVEAYKKMGWVYGEKRDPEKKTHPDMVPYKYLGQLERDKDDVFFALCEIARQWIYDIPAEEDMKNG